MTWARFTCHECGTTFEDEVDNEWGLYEVSRCPTCGSARTTLAVKNDAGTLSGD